MWILPKQIQSTTSVYAQATRESELDSGEFCQMCEKSLMWRSKPSLSRTWSTRLKRGSFIKHLFTRTLRPSLTESFEDWWTSSVEDFPASRLVKPELEKLRKTQDTCSPSSQKESESANLELFSSKTLKESSVARPKTENQFSDMSSEHWKKWVTEQRQEYSQRVKSASHIREKEFTSWGTQAVRNWSTPRASATDSSRPNNKGGIPLSDQVKRNWATPSTMDNLPARSPEKLAEAKKKGGCKNLREEVVNPKNWGTPKEQDSRAALTDRGKQNFPTPTARDWKDTAGSKRGRDLSLPKMLFGCTNDGPQDQTKSNTNGKNPVSLKLNPDWVEQLMGLPVGWTDFDCSEME